MSNLTESEIVNDINKIITFLSKRDINELSCRELVSKFGISQVDMVIILGNSIPYITELGEKVYKNNLAKDIMIVGGIGHSTKYLIENILKDDNYKNIDVYDKSEADILKQIIVLKENIDPDKIIIESKSTNCGSNAVEALKILRDKGRIPKSVILIQDPTMQLRSQASFSKAWDEEKTLIISYSPFVPKVKKIHGGYEYVNDKIKGLWSKNRFIDLIMGEIPRLRDDKDGYGPNGKGFISHVDIPREVSESYERLLSYYVEYNEIRNRK